jgi:hypothetical protein
VRKNDNTLFVLIILIDDETNLKRQIYNQFNNKNITNESDSSSEEDDPVVAGYDGYQPLRRSTRMNAGIHSNINRLPRSVAKRIFSYIINSHNVFIFG